jgi:hypothetical protein
VGTATSDGLRLRALRPHAHGGLGAIFVALDTERHCEVALKQILDSHADHEDSRRRFLVEAEITGGLEHPGIDCRGFRSSCAFLIHSFRQIYREFISQAWCRVSR